jgi:anaerobic ribonucleoside-triphosphate reductase activating protein
MRLGIWVQGCSKNCPGCCNPETHDFSKGEEIDTEEIVSLILKHRSEIEGVSISGGEPLDQSEELLEILRYVREDTSLSVIIWTGYTRSELDEMRLMEELSKLVDLIIIGPYVEQLHKPEGLRGSSNQDYIFFTKRYKEEDLKSLPSAEVIFEKGVMKITGVDAEQIRLIFD